MMPMRGVMSPVMVSAANLPSSHTLWFVEGGVLVFIAVVVVTLVALRRAYRRDLRRRRAGAEGYFDADVARMGLGPGGFQGARAASQATSKPLAPSFGPPGSAGQPAVPGFASATPAPGAATNSGASFPGNRQAMHTGVAPANPAGWYPDPNGDPSLLRYWDGNGWTAHVEPRP